MVSTLVETNDDIAYVDIVLFSFPETRACARNVPHANLKGGVRFIVLLVSDPVELKIHNDCMKNDPGTSGINLNFFHQLRLEKADGVKMFPKIFSMILSHLKSGGIRMS